MSSISNWLIPAEVFKNPFVQCPYFDLGCCAVLFVDWGRGGQGSET